MQTAELFCTARAEMKSVIREIREAQGLSQRAVAQSLGVTPGAVAKWELGYTQPTLGNLLSLASLLGCSMDTLLGLASGQTPA